MKRKADMLQQDNEKMRKQIRVSDERQSALQAELVRSTQELKSSRREHRPPLPDTASLQGSMQLALRYSLQLDRRFSGSNLCVASGHARPQEHHLPLLTMVALACSTSSRDEAIRSSITIPRGRITTTLWIRMNLISSSDDAEVEAT